MNKYTAEAKIELAGKPYTLSFDWAARAAFKSKYADDSAVTKAVTNGAENPEILADLVEVCLKKHHPEITANFIMQNSPPIIPLARALEAVILYSLWGPDGPPSEAQEQDDTKKNPQ